MPGKRVSSDPREIKSSVQDADPNQAGIQDESQGGGQYTQGEHPRENAYVENRVKPE